MDSATVLLTWIVGVLCLWFTGTLVPPALAAVSRVGVRMPIGSRFAAVMVTIVLLLGAVRTVAATAGVGPPSQRMSQMVDRDASQGTDVPVAGILPLSRFRSASTYTVANGDSLWRIARSVLSVDGSRPSGAQISDFWRAIYSSNRDLIGNDPNLIHPGQVLQLPGR